MKAFLLLLFSTVLVVSAVADEKSSSETYRLPQDAVDALSTGTEFVLYSLDPGPTLSMRLQHLKPEEDFHGFKILGRLVLKDPKIRAAAVTAVTNAIGHADYHHIDMCFFPRHALQVTAKERVLDFVICYECGQIRLFEKGAFVAIIGIPSAPEALNKILTDAGIPLADPPFKKSEK